MMLGANPTSTVLPATLDFTPSNDSQTTVEENTDQKHTGQPKTGQDSEEFLESHEVIEINKFTERKEWIEEKIKFLENMPPVQVFTNADAFASFPEELPPGLPTRAQHDEWLKEHDKIEKETEIFDAGDMSKLKKLTKAATQRNLSPEDTDLIEVTLKTLFALDKLLHLLRDRSEQLELLGLRLTWEEQRVIAWRERRQIMEDIKSFLATRARWSADVYVNLTDQAPSPYMGSRFKSPSPGPAARPSSALSLRRDSVASITSESSTAGLNLPSRSARYKLAETLSHDAAILSGRLTTLNHAKVVAAGKTLDKLIDTSRKPVPDEILDEQDALEDKAVKELESVGKFVMAVVMQWKRADEYYSDIIKDQGAAKALLSELANASLQHPSQRLDSSFMARAQALTKRLTLKANPKNSFLRPLHPLFPDQATANDALVEALNAEFTDAIELARKAEANALDYHQKVKAVKQAEDALIRMNGFCHELETIAEQLTGHIPTSNEHGDPSPPNLESESCLEATRHAAYVALAPAILRKFEELDSSSESVLYTANQTHLRLKTLSGVDSSFQVDFASTIKRLQCKRQETKMIKEKTEVRIAQLKEARRLWAILNNIMDNAENTTSQTAEYMKIQRWKPLGSLKRANPATPDPDSPPNVPLPPIVLVPNDLLTTLNALDERLQVEFLVPSKKLLPSLPSSLSSHLNSSFEGVSFYIRSALGLIQLWKNIVDQSVAMAAICHETEGLIHEIVALESEIEDLQDRILRGDSIDTFDTDESRLASRAKDLEKPVENFITSFPKRILLVSSNANVRQKPRSNSISSSDHYLHRLKEPSDPEPSVDITILNNDIRDDSNGFALKLSGAMEALSRSQRDLHLSGVAIRTDRLIEKLEDGLQETEKEMTALRSLLDTVLPSVRVGVSTEVLDQLITFSKSYDDISNRHTALTSELIQSIREAVQIFESAVSSRSDSPFCTGVISNRLKSCKEALAHANIVETMFVQLKETLEIEKNKEQQRLRTEEERLSKQKQEAKVSSSPSNANDLSRKSQEFYEEDVFGMPILRDPKPSNLTNLHSRIMSLRSRLKSFSDNVSMACYPSDLSAAFPGLEQISKSQYIFSALDDEIKELPPKVDNPDVNREVNSLRYELDKARALLERLILLGEVSKKITICDNAFSDLLEHVDSYPAPPPSGTLASDHVSDPYIPCEEQLKARLIYCTDQMDSVAQAAVTLNDSRVLNEQARLRQTLLELRAMCIDRINGTHSRPASTASSSRSASVVGTPIVSTPKNKPVLAGKAPQARFPSRDLSRETDRSSRRSVSGSQNVAVKPSAHSSDRSHMSNRSVSGPLMASTLFSPTFASRQRTTSLASTSQATPPAVRTRTVSRRPGSPTNSEMSAGRARTTSSRGTWARAPRQSFGSSLRSLSTEPRKREAYVPNPKSKLDVAVGHVVNNFKLPVTVQIAEEGWKDQSGKYWIGDAEPKLCFCRILRSQTVMVRVGGGWCELSKFLKGHFADLLAELPPSPPKNEEKWISSLTLREEEDSPVSTVPRSPMTPEPRFPTLPSLQLLTPSGTSPRSIRTTSTTPESKSPSLTPFQYMRRADMPIRPSTPSSRSSHRLKPNDTPSLHRAITPPRPHVWRP